MKKRICLLLVLSATLIAGNAQKEDKKRLDSLLTMLHSTQADSIRLKAYATIQAYFFNLGQYDSALAYGTQSLQIARRLNDKKILTKFIYNAGITSTNLALYDSAMTYLNEAEILASEMTDTLVMLHALNGKSLVAKYQANHSQAVEYLIKAAHIIERTTTQSFIDLLPHIYGNLGQNLIAEKQYESGIAYLKRALLIKKYPDEKRISTLHYLELCNAYLELNKSAIAKLHLDTAVQLNSEMHNYVLANLVANTEGVYYNKVGNPAAALNAYLRSYQWADSSRNEYLKALPASNIAELYLLLNKLRDAEKYATTGSEIAKKFKNYAVLISSYRVLKQVFLQQKEYQRAIQYAELELTYKDSASTKEAQKTILNLEARYQNVKKEKEIASLTLINAEKELQVTKRNRFLLMGGIAAGTLLLTTSLLYRNNRQKRLLAEKDKLLKDEQIKFLERQQQVVSLQSMINGQETERTRIAKDLHDGLGGLFSTIKMHYSTLQNDTPQLTGNPLYKKTQELISNASEELRRVAHNMMPEVLLKVGLPEALRDMSNNISSGKILSVSFQSYGMEQRLSPATEIMLYRIVQELMNNIIKHSSATTALIQFNRNSNRLSLTIEDNGNGFDTAEAAQKQSMGITTIRNRVEYLNGELSIDSQKNIGTTVMIDILLNEN